MKTALAVLMLAVSELFPDVSQPRKTFDKEKLAHMAANIAARGFSSRSGCERMSGVVG